MGVDLRLLPVDVLHTNADGTVWGFSHTILSAPRRRELWTAINAMEDVEYLPEGADISSHIGGTVDAGSSEGESTYGRLTEDAYGHSYTWVAASDLVPAFRKHLPGHPVTAYLAALKADTKIILDWH